MSDMLPLRLEPFNLIPYPVHIYTGGQHLTAVVPAPGPGFVRVGAAEHQLPSAIIDHHLKIGDHRYVGGHKEGLVMCPSQSPEQVDPSVIPAIWSGQWMLQPGFLELGEFIPAVGQCRTCFRAGKSHGQGRLPVAAGQRPARPILRPNYCPCRRTSAPVQSKSVRPPPNWKGGEKPVRNQARPSRAAGRRTEAPDPRFRRAWPPRWPLSGTGGRRKCAGARNAYSLQRQRTCCTPWAARRRIRSWYRPRR